MVESFQMVMLFDGENVGGSFSNVFNDGSFWNLVICMDEVSNQTDKIRKDTFTDRDDIHLGALKKLGDETAKTLLHVSKFMVR